jgi:hypothetical protein
VLNTFYVFGGKFSQATQLTSFIGSKCLIPIASSLAIKIRLEILKVFNSSFQIALCTKNTQVTYAVIQVENMAIRGC